MIKGFLKYVEIMTKITSLFVFLMSLAYLYYLGAPVNRGLTALFFAGMFLFDLTTTAINNYIDTKANTQTLPLPRGLALAVLLALLTVSVLCGLWLAWLTDAVVLITGAICFVCGIFYTFGPLPISRLPLGEVFSGVFYGLMIPFLLFYINLPEGTLLSLSFSPQEVSLSARTAPMAALLLLSAAPVLTTANIMFANNICDLEKDVLVKRHTLPYYLGRWSSLKLFAWIYYAIYAAELVLAACGVLPSIHLLFLFTLIPVQENIRRFQAEQDKETTFLCSIQNYIIIMGADAALILLAGFLTRLAA